jgi:hypothetical protein
MKNVVARLAFGTALISMGLYGADSLAGKWKFNPAKSTTTDSNPVKNRSDVREETPDGGEKVTRTEELKDGTTRNYSYTYKNDGKDYPVTGAQFDSVAVKRVDANTTTFVTKSSTTKYHLTGRFVVSKDGKTLTQTYEGTDASGKPISTTNVFDRQ